MNININNIIKNLYKKIDYLIDIKMIKYNFWCMNRKKNQLFYLGLPSKEDIRYVFNEIEKAEFKYEYKNVRQVDKTYIVSSITGEEENGIVVRNT